MDRVRDATAAIGCLEPMSGSGPLSTDRRCPRSVSFTPNTGSLNDRAKSTSRAKLGQSALQQNGDLFDHLVGEREQARWHGDAERLGSREIDNELEFGRLLDRDITGLCPA